MKTRTKVKENTPSLWSIPPLCAEDNKYTRGSIAILGGEVMTGAARLAALAAQRAGAGLVTIAATPKTWPIYAASMLSVMVRPCGAKEWRALVADVRVRAVLVGSGAGINARTKNALMGAAASSTPLIIDADGITILARDVALRTALHATPKILTPHEGEAARLATALKLSPKLDKLALAQALAKGLNAIVVLKGSDTYITDGQRMHVSHPPAWLATAGTGDVLAGVITALVGQGMELFDAAAAGVWLHAEAAHMHGRGMIAEDVLASIPTLLRTLK